MDNNKNNNDISADELLKKFKENLEFDLSGLELSEGPSDTADKSKSAEEIIALRSRKKAGLEPSEPADEKLVIPELTHEFVPVSIPAEASEPEDADLPFNIPPTTLKQDEPEETVRPDLIIPGLNAPVQEDNTEEISEAVAEAYAEVLAVPDPESFESSDTAEPTGFTEAFRYELAKELEPETSRQNGESKMKTSEFLALALDGQNEEEPTSDTIEFEAPAEEDLSAGDEIDTPGTFIPEPVSADGQVLYDIPPELVGEMAMTAEFDAAMAEPVAGLFEEALKAPVAQEKPTTKEIEMPAADSAVPDEPISNEQIDTLMRTYLTGSEYDEVTKQRNADTELVRHISEAEEYVSSIEQAKLSDEPHEPLTETEKVIKEMELDTGEPGEPLDEVDVNLMIAFGMEKELAEKLGEDKAKDVENALDIDAENLNFSRFEKPETTELPDDMEFISQNQIKDVFKVYRRKQRNLIIRFFGAAVMTLLLFIFENITLFGGSFEGTFLDPTIFPVVHSMISLQLCFFVLAFIRGTVLTGLKSLFTFKPTAKSALALVALFTVIYHVAFCFLYNGGDTVFCTFPLALGVLITIISEYISLKRDIYSFNIVSSKRIKYFISEIPAEEEALERNTFAEYIDEDSNVSRVSKAAFIDGFFHRTKESTRPIPVLRAILPLPVAIAVFFFLFSAFVRNDPYLGLTSAYISLMLSTPASLMLVTAVPFYRASKIAYEQGGAIIGEDSLEEYSDVAAISFDDKDVFPSGGVKIRSIKVYNNNRIDRVIYNVASLFKHIGGPLADVYSIATKDFECSDDVEIVDIQDDGIEAVISGKHIFLGRESFLVRNNFSPVLDMEDQRIEANGSTSITFLVTNDQVSAKIYTSYSIDPGFAAIAKQLYRAGMCLGIKTFDPGIDDTLLGRFIDLTKYPVKIIKCRSMADKLTTEEKADSGIVSKKSARSLLKTLSLCEKVNSCAKTGTFIAMLSIIIGFAISAFLLFHGLSNTVSGVYVALYQVFWLIPTVIISHLNVNR